MTEEKDEAMTDVRMCESPPEQSIAIFPLASRNREDVETVVERKDSFVTEKVVSTDIMEDVQHVAVATATFTLAEASTISDAPDVDLVTNSAGPSSFQHIASKTPVSEHSVPLVGHGDSFAPQTQAILPITDRMEVEEEEEAERPPEPPSTSSPELSTGVTSVEIDMQDAPRPSQFAQSGPDPRNGPKLDFLLEFQPDSPLRDMRLVRTLPESSSKLLENTANTTASFKSSSQTDVIVHGGFEDLSSNQQTVATSAKGSTSNDTLSDSPVQVARSSQENNIPEVVMMGNDSTFSAELRGTLLDLLGQGFSASLL